MSVFYLEVDLAVPHPSCTGLFTMLRLSCHFDLKSVRFAAGVCCAEVTIEACPSVFRIIET